MAIPTTPAPASNGMIWTPRPVSTVSTVTTAAEEGERVAKDRQQSAQPSVAGEFVSAAAGASKLEPVFDVGLR